MWTRPCLHAHTGVYVDANAFTPTRLGGRPYVPAGTQTCCLQTKQTRAPTGTRKHVCKRENETKCARARRNGLGMRLLARAHTRVYANRHLSVCAHGSARGQTYIRGNTSSTHTWIYTCVCKTKYTRAQPRPRAARYSTCAQTNARVRGCIFGYHLCL